MNQQEKMAAARAARKQTRKKRFCLELTPKQQKYLEYIKQYIPTKVKHFYKAFSRKSMKSAIAAKCIDCMGYEPHRISDCNIEDCPLWRYRPYQKKNAIHVENTLENT